MARPRKTRGDPENYRFQASLMLHSMARQLGGARIGNTENDQKDAELRGLFELCRKAGLDPYEVLLGALVEKVVLRCAELRRKETGDAQLERIGKFRQVRVLKAMLRAKPEERAEVGALEYLRLQANPRRRTHDRTWLKFESIRNAALETWAPVADRVTERFPTRQVGKEEALNGKAMDLARVFAWVKEGDTFEGLERSSALAAKAIRDESTTLDAALVDVFGELPGLPPAAPGEAGIANVPR